jgi:hypothetical protein
MLDEVASHRAQRRRAHNLRLATQFLDDLPSSDAPSLAHPNSDSSSSPSSLSSISSPSSGTSDSSSSSSHSAHLEHSPSIFGDLDSLEDTLLDRWDAQTQELAAYLLTARVLEACPPVKKLGQLGLYLTDFRDDHPDRFRKKLRVSPPVFDRLVELIEDNGVFHNNSNVPQHPIPIQLAIFLARLGHYGNASSPEYVAQWAGVCVGTVINATYRCLVAFLALHDEAVMMPPVEEKERAKEYVERATCPEWRNGFLLADGTKFVLFQKPGLHGEAWFDKNKNYSIDCQVREFSSQPAYTDSALQIISMPQNLLIVDYSLGHTGSVHDAWAFRSTRTFKDHEKIFGPGEWMWADSAYTPETWSVAPFKKPINGQLTADQRTYNYWVSKVSTVFNVYGSTKCYIQIRIRVEHTMGLLKGTFQSLKEIRIQLVNTKRHKLIIMWARVCIILHNLIIRIEGDNFDDQWRESLMRTGLEQERDAGDDTDEEEPGDALEQAQRRLATPGQRFRLQLMDSLFDSPFLTVERRP